MTEYKYLVYDRFTQKVVTICDTVAESTAEARKVPSRCAVIYPIEAAAAEWYEACAE